MILTNKGLALQGKAQAGAQLNYTRIAVGDGSLSGQSIPALNGLISPKKTLPVKRLRTQPPNKVIVGTVLSNAEITAGFYFREVGVFAQDPDAGEILYAYANSGVTADYVAPGGGTDIIEKVFDCIVTVGTAANITATMDHSLVFARESDVNAKFDPSAGHKHTGAAGDAPKITSSGLADSSVGTVQLGAKAVTQAKIGDKAVGTAQLADGGVTDAVIGSRTLSDVTAPSVDTGSLTALFSGLANMIKQTTGGATWRTLPVMTIAAIKALLDAATNAATASTLIKRDASGRAQVAAPSAAADIARKDTVDTAISTAAADAGSKASAAQTAAIAAAATDATEKANAAQAAAISAAASDASTKANAVQTNLTAHIGSGGAAHADVTTTTDGFMIAADKVKLNGIAAGANAYVHPNHTGDVTSSGDGVTAIAPGVIVDADVNSAAAIGWSKINKTGSSLADLGTKSAADLTSGTLPAARLPAVSGDITMAAGTGTAAITAGAIVDSDINSSAAIGWSKVNSTAAISDVDVSTTAAIGWSKINKTGASLADLPTRSAGDLSSGTLPAARLPAISGDITMAAGTGAAVITAGAIVNADVNAAAAIDASKIGTGVVNNTEFGYLDGVTSGIQGQINSVVKKSGDTMTGTLAGPKFEATAAAGLSHRVSGDTVGLTLYRSGTNDYQIRVNDTGANVQQDTAKPSVVLALDATAASPTARFWYRPPGGDNNSWLNSWEINSLSGDMYTKDKNAMVKGVAARTTADITYYVRTDGNDMNTGLANTAAGAFKTITKALSMVPQVVDHTVIIYVAAGTYTEAVNVQGFTGRGSLNISGATAATTTHNVTGGVSSARNLCRISIVGLRSTTTTTHAFYVIGSNETFFQYCSADVTTSQFALYVESAKVYFCNSIITGRSNIAVYAHVNGEIFVQECNGSSNNIGHQASYGGRIHINGSFISSTIKKNTSEGGIVTDGAGATNPWGDNTTQYRTAAAGALATAGQAVGTGVFTKINYGVEFIDYLGEWNLSTATFVPQQSGQYQLTSVIAIPGMPGGYWAQVSIFKDSKEDQCLARGMNSNTNDLIVSGSITTDLVAGHSYYFGIYHNSPSSINLSTDGHYCHFRIVRVS
ncbi:hypothetical protein NST84_27305 [Paenibacillus sp. FSL R7-0345]|uniref:hypothetical protein n=1 Tax=Paenibacillus sp. FSL R7-0345 TaxID=2954535 RepID=UPI00315B0A9C